MPVGHLNVGYGKVWGQNSRKQISQSRGTWASVCLGLRKQPGGQQGRSGGGGGGVAGSRSRTCRAVGLSLRGLWHPLRAKPGP